MRKGRKSASQTPAPLKDRIYGSDKNKVGSASSEKSAKNISLSMDILVALTKKLKEFKKENPNSKNITLNDLKAVYRRGLGAYSSTHRPTITGGVPNTRNAWAMARVNKFLLKASGEKVKKAYFQDDDLMKYAEGGELGSYSIAIKEMGLQQPFEWNAFNEEETIYVPENEIYGWLYDVPNSQFFIDNEDFDIVTIDSALGDFWKNLKSKKGSKKLLAVLKGRLSKDKTKLYILSMTTKNEFRKKGLMSKLIREVRNKYNIDKENVIFIGLTDMGQKMYKKKRYADGGLIAPNGNPSNLSPEQYKLVRTPEFKSWFGDWENSPETASKVVDENGEPMVVYHGTTKDFNIFTKKYIGKNDYGYFGQGFYFGDINSAEAYSQTSLWNQIHNTINPNGKVLKCFLNVRNPLIDSSDNLMQSQETSKDFTKNIIQEYDGIIAITYKRFSPNTEYVVFEPNQIKLADGTNTTFDNNNPDIRYNQGGNLKNNNMFETLGKLFRPQNINYIAKEQNVSEEYARMQLAKGIEHEFEHTNDYETAKTIALHHLAENIDYYIMLEKAENQVKDKNYDDHFKQVYAQGGSINFAFQTPTGKPTKLTYLQQVLVRTSSFKKWFGDWEKSAKEYIITDDFEKSFSGVSKCLDMETLEPRVVFHGTRTNEEFFVFNANMKGGRPYGYFAVNEQYSENFTTSSQTGLGNNPYLYRVFLSVKNPFKAIGHSFDTKMKNAEYWKTIIAGQIQWQKNKSLEKDERLTKAVESQIGRFVDEICSTGDVPFWMFMSRDVNSIFKRFLMSWGFDSVEFSENIRENFDVNNPSEFTYAYTIFDAPQVKLADGRNVEFNMQSDDMRYENGGNLNDENMNKYEHLKNVIGGEGYYAEPIYKSGGSVQSQGNNKKDDATKGGYFVGRPHSQGGIKAINISTNSPIEVEGGEVIITKPAVEDNKKRMFEGEMLTNREILSKINQSGGGVPIFEEGGMCGCSGKKYNFGGNVVEDFRGIYDYMVKPYIVEPISETMQYVDSLIIKRKK